MVNLSDRERELLEVMVSAGVESEQFVIQPGEDYPDDSTWPTTNIAKPTKAEIRSMIGRGLLTIDKTVARAWVFWPSPEARQEFADEDASRRTEALSDPDARLGLILDAIVEAFEADPSSPLMIFQTDQADIVRHPRWSIEADVVRMHDLRQLEALELIGWNGETEFFPTLSGRMAAKDPAAFLSRRAEEVSDSEESSRLQRMAEKLRAGDLAVSVAGGVTGAAIRTALGL